MKVKNTLTILLLSTLFLSGCGISDAKKTDEVSTSESTREKTTENLRDEIVVSLGEEPEEGFDPTTGWGKYEPPLFQSTLFKRDKDMMIVSDLGIDYSVSEDGMTWTVPIQEDILFSDGHPLNAKDVVFTYETSLNSSSVVDLNMLESVEAKDEFTVVFHLKKPQSTFVSKLVEIGIVPEHAYDENYGDNPIGSGPFKMVQYDKGQQIIIEPNPMYYDQNTKFDKITILFLEEDARVAAAKAGQLDVASIPATMANQEVKGMDLVALQSVDNRAIVYPVVPSGNKTEEGYPIGNDVTSDIAIRKAIDLAIDRNQLVEGVLNGYGTKASSLADDLPWYNPETEVSGEGHKEEAIQILEEAGWKKTSDGIREKDGQKAQFDLYYVSSDKVRQSLSIAIADEMEEIGIEITPKGEGWDEILKQYHSSPALMGYGGYNPAEIYDIYHTDSQGKPFYNPGYYSNDKVDEYIEKALEAKNEEEALDNWKNAQWDGTTGVGSNGDTALTWLINLEHLYLVKDDLDIGEKQIIQPHGHGWPVTHSILEWKIK